MRVCLTDLQRVSHEDYVAAFGWQRGTIAPGHAVFMYRTKHMTWVIPALALMRAIFKSSKWLLEEMFRPQALQRLVVQNPNNKELLHVAPWKDKIAQTVVSDCDALHWLWNDPAAWRMASSVHRHAMNGRLDMDLEPITLALTSRGRIRGPYIFATSVFVAEAEGTPEASAKEPVVFRFATPLANRKSVHGASKNLHAARRADGTIDVTDEEWANLQPHVAPAKRGRPSKSDLRAAFNGILHKLTGETTAWKALATVGHPASLYLGHYVRWLETGALPKMLDELNRSREYEQGAESQGNL